MVTTTTPGGQHVSICTCTRTGCHLTKFTRRPGSSLYTLNTKPPQVAASAQVSASGPVAAPCSGRLLSHQTLLWHHRLGHPSLPCLRCMHSCLLLSSLPRSLPPLPPSPTPPSLPCVEGRQHAAPHSSSFPPTTAPLQTLHMDVKGEVPDVLIPWIRTFRLQLRERREPESRPASRDRAVRTSRRVPRPRPPPVPGTHIMALRPSSVPLRVPLPSPPASSFADGSDLDSYLVRAASPIVTRLLATVVTVLSFESAAASALVAELVDFAAVGRLDYAASLVVESESECPPSVGGECALGTDVLEDRQEDFECLAAAVPHLLAILLAPEEGDPDAPDIPTPRSFAEAITGPYSSHWQIAMDTEMASWKSTGTYVDAVPPPGANIVDGMWIFRVKWPPGSPPAFKARYVARGFSHVHEEIWLRRPPGFIGSFPAGTQWSLQRPVYGLRQAPREWHDTLRMSLAALGFAPSTTGPSLFLRSDTSLPSLYILMVLRYLCSTSGMGLVLGGGGPFVLNGHADASWVHDLATQRSSQGYTFILGSGSVSWRSTRSSSVLSSSCEAEIYAGAMAAQELRWLTYLLTDLGERPRSPPVVYIDNKAMIALCQEHRLEHRTKHIALCYFLTRELQQRDQLRLAYVATRASTADIFTKALQSGYHQRFCTVLGLVPTLPHTA
ncbi:unnamed protein product [Closterium sp. NIES-54]